MEHMRDPDVVALIVDEYSRAGGAPLLDGVSLFATGVAVWLNFLRTRALIALDESQVVEQREHATEALRALIRDMAGLGELQRAAAAIG
jgi:hypothetical protein